jgi:diaminohydroxyphosphoribosylaminopyrimidine deaminase/5-amino-6-(5-phosphoribosylamino)uracil reductase
VLVREGHTLGEGFHHRRGEPHAEVEALRAAHGDARGATLYASLEPCDHEGLTPPCTRAVIAAGVARVVIGALDPNPKTAGAGVARLRAGGIAVDVVDDARARDLVDAFAVAIRSGRPFVTLKLAASLDGYVAPRPGPYWLTGAEARAFVRELRASHDAVMVGAGTVIADDPQLTVRPPHARTVPYRRVVVSDRPSLPRERRVFAPANGYLPTLVLGAGPSGEYGQLEGVAEVICVGKDGGSMDVGAGLVALKERGIESVLCEGGPRLAARLLARGLVDRVHWLVAPRLLAGPEAVPALASRAELGGGSWAIDRTARLGADVLLSARAVRSA